MDQLIEMKSLLNKVVEWLIAMKFYYFSDCFES